MPWLPMGPLRLKWVFREDHAEREEGERGGGGSGELHKSESRSWRFKLGQARDGAENYRDKDRIADDRTRRI